MYIVKRAFRTALAALALCGMGNAHAALVNFSLTGDVDAFADPGNAFGLNLNDQIFASGTFDDSVLAGGSGTVSFGSGSGNSMMLTVGSMTFFETDDDDFATGFPQLDLLAGGFDGLNYATTLALGGFFDSTAGFFDGEDASFNLISGSWDAASFTLTAVPVPAAVWLFGSGLAGLAGIARRKRSA